MYIKIYDTLSQKIKHINRNHIGIYICGITPYDDSHIGHARTIIIFDILRRYLEYQHVDVKIIQNFTDVDDKIIQRAKNENTTIDKITVKFINRYYNDFKKLNIKSAFMYPKATEHIQDIINLIQVLLNKKIAYITNNGIYFSVLKFNKYGSLSKKNIDELSHGLRIAIDDEKKSPLDFALWKFFTEQPIWNSPWGSGRPGWHIECSAMGMKYLGKSFEIHGGGNDLIFPHHENEIAQSESCTLQQLAKIWMHIGIVTINGKKMSKSLGNVQFLNNLLQQYGPNVIKLFCILTHYSKPLDFSSNLFQPIIDKWRQIESCYYGLLSLLYDDNNDNDNIISSTNIHHIQNYTIEFNNALYNNLNTVSALSVLLKFVKKINELIITSTVLSIPLLHILLNHLKKFLDILGLTIMTMSTDEIVSINNLIKQRNIFRINKQYQNADKIRNKLNLMNITLIDYTSKTLWIKNELN